MPQSLVSGNVQQIVLTPCRVNFGGIDVGFTSGGVTVSIAEQKAEIKTDYFGASVIDRANVGAEILVKCKLDQLTPDSLKRAFPHARIVGTSTKTIVFGHALGDRDVDYSQELVLHPISKTDSDKSGDWTFWKAAAIGKSDITYNAENQIGIEVEFRIYPDISKPHNKLWGIFGDPGANMVDAQAGTPSFTGTGNGTMTNVAVNNLYTKTETWTATCIKKITNGGKFEVVGSITGARGVAVVGSTFYSNSANPSKSEISFLINDGSIDFEEGDQFTVATTAANYQ